MLEHEELFLSFYLRAELFLRRQKSLVFGSEELFVAFENGVTSNILACLRTKYNTDGRIVAFRALQLIVHPNIHIHLPHILMGNSSKFQVDEDIAFQYNIIEQTSVYRLAFVISFIFHSSLSPLVLPFAKSNFLISSSGGNTFLSFSGIT